VAGRGDHDHRANRDVEAPHQIQEGIGKLERARVLYLNDGCAVRTTPPPPQAVPGESTDLIE
jgi:hypothetical protein